MGEGNLRDDLVIRQISDNCFILICEVLDNKEYKRHVCDINLLTFRDKLCIHFYTYPTLPPAHYKYTQFADCMWRHCTKPTLVKDYFLYR